MEWNKLIDHTLLKPEATREEILTLCAEAKENHFASVCVNPCFIRVCAAALKESDVHVCTVIGFPLGASTMASKISEAKYALYEGADELDMVINVGRLKDHDDAYVKKEIAELKRVCNDKILKVIIECCLLTDEEKVRACKLAKEAGADFVKTSTGFAKGGATVEDVRLMRETVGPDMGVKAAGGIRDKKTMEAMVEAGATRIGTSHGVALIQPEETPAE